MSTDVCLRTLASPNDVDLYDLLTCTAATVGGGAPGGRRFVVPVPIRRDIKRLRAERRAHVRVGASMSYEVSPTGRLAEEDLLLDLL